MSTITKRKRYYKKFFLNLKSIPTTDTWKNLIMLDSDGVTEIENKIEFPSTFTTIVISLDDEDRILEYSYNGRNLDGELFCDDGPFSQDCAAEGYLYFRLPEGTTLDTDETVQVRLWAWSGGVGK